MNLEKEFKEGAYVSLVKTRVLDGKRSMVKIDELIKGKLIFNEWGGITVRAPGSYIEGASWVQTSAVKNIIESTDKMVVFETETSVYKLEYL